MRKVHLSLADPDQVKAEYRFLLGNPYFEVLRHDVTFPLYVEVDVICNFITTHNMDYDFYYV